MLETLGDHLRKRRLDRGLTQKELAAMLGVDETSVYNWEKNRCRPARQMMQKIAAFMNQ